MSALTPVTVRAIDPRRFDAVLDPDQYAALLDLMERGERGLRGRAIVNINSTSQGGGVVELLVPLLGYARGAGVDARWKVISGTTEFFAVTKRLHNRLHGFHGDGGELGEHERDVYEGTLAASALELRELLRPGDVAILHDPQTAGLVDAARAAGAHVIWRCHIGLDTTNDVARSAWDFLRPYVRDAHAQIFSRPEFVWEGLDARRVHIVQPTIDAFAPKNAEQRADQSRAILGRAAILADGDLQEAVYERADGTPGRVDRIAEVVEDAPLRTDDRVVVQVSRWDSLKDPIGVMASFAEYVAPTTDAHLMLAGPETASVTDDPEGARVHAETIAAREQVDPSVRRRIHLAALPMADVDENAVIVNALQRHASVVVQKSLAEGFGLTVAEAMWKHRPVVASRVGGIQDQVVDGESGVLIDDASDLQSFGGAIASLLVDPPRAARMGAAAHERVRRNFLGPTELARYYDLIELLIAGG